jgi:hypothetical protein
MTCLDQKMMRRVGWAGIVLLAACSSFSSSPDDQPAPADAAVPPGPADATPEEAQSDAGAQTILHEDFEDGTCGAWTPISGALFIPAPGEGRDGGGACRLTFGAGGSIRLFVPASETGTYELTAWAKKGTRGVSALGNVFFAIDGSAGDYQDNAVVLTDAYARIQVVMPESVAPEEARLGFAADITTDDAGADYLLDDVTFVKRP